jgi:hypothetical protein
MKNGKVFETKTIEGTERAAVLVIMPMGSGTVMYLCHAWGRMEGMTFLDTVEGNRIEVHGELSFLIQVPAPGMTYEISGKCRELQVSEPSVTLQ